MNSTPTTVAEAVDKLKHILATDLQLNVMVEDIRNDYSLLEDGLALDSILIEELIAQIERQFELQFDDRILDARLFANLTTLAAFVVDEQTAAASRRGTLTESTAGGA